MPAELFRETGDLARCYALLLAGVAPLGYAAWRLGRPLPGWRVPRPPADGPGVFALFAVQFLGPGLVLGLFFADAAKPPDAFALTTATGLASAALLAVASRPRTPNMPTPREVAAGAAAWAVGHPVVFACYAVALLLIGLAGGAPDEHPLIQTPPADLGGRLLALVVICGVVPAAEEVAFRGRLLPWLAERRHRVAPIAFGAVVLTSVAAKRPEAVGFAALTGLAALLARGRLWRAVLASSALFAAGHSSVWPTPVPLFAGAVGLGWLTVRTGGVAAGVVAHGLFNAVSVVYVLGR